MADKRISQLVERTDIANNDVVPIVAFGATTTNKATISSIQEFMQENLDLGVTSVGITLGTTGTDVNVTGSPITTSGNITINIPTASASNRGLLSSSDWSTFTNDRVPYTGATGGVNLGFNPLSASQININGTSPTGGSYLGFKHSNSVTTGTDGYTSMYTFGTNTIGFKSVSGATNKDFSFSMVGITAGVPGGRIYNLPDASGTLALTSDLDGYVTLNTAQTINGFKTFSNTIFATNGITASNPITISSSGNSDSLEVNHSSGSGIALDISKGGNGEGLRVAKTSGTGNAVTITGGLLSAEAATLTGALNGTSASFTGGVNLATSSGNVGIGTANPLYRLDVLEAGATTASNTFSMARITGSDSVANDLTLIGPNTSQVRIKFGDPEDATIGEIGYNHSNNSLRLNTNGATRLTIDSAGSVGIGTDSPLSNLHVRAASGSASVRIQDSTNTTSLFLQSQNGLGVVGTITNHALRFDTNDAERMRITSAGNVGIGTASPADKLHIDGGASYPFIRIQSSGNSTARYLKIGLTDALLHTIEAVGPSTSINFLASGAERMRITSDGYQRMASGTGGIQFNGDTAAANALDDYEEGTWTPVYTASNGGTASYASQAGRYTKIGRVVNVILWIRSNKGTLSGNISISGLPFSSPETTVIPVIPYRRFASTFELFGDCVGTSINLYKVSSVSTSVIPLTDVDFSNLATNYNNIGISFSYFV